MTGVEAIEELHEIAQLALKGVGSSDEDWEQFGKRFFLALAKISVLSGFYAWKVQQTQMSEPIPSLAEAMAENRRLRARIEVMEAEVAIARGTLEQWDAEQHEKVRWYRARAQAAEAELAIAQGTLAKPTEDEPPFHVEHNVPPSAPPHNERPPIGNDDE